jgi:glycosyltransferase involved in cell wall biosynthesis
MIPGRPNRRNVDDNASFCPDAPTSVKGERVRVAFLVRSLAAGGAEIQLAALANGLPRDIFDPVIVTYYPNGVLEPDIREAGIPIVCAQKKGRWDTLAFTYRLAQIFRAIDPDIIHGYLGPSNIIVTGLGAILGIERVVWGIRASDTDLAQYDWSWRSIFLAERFLSSRPAAIVANSWAGRDHLLRSGFSESRLKVIENGYDLDRFRPDLSGGSALRQSWRRPTDSLLIGYPARLDPVKDHPTFLRAAAEIVQARHDVRFICIGDGPTSYREELQDLTKSLGIDDAILWAGYRKDMPDVYNALDAVVLCSTSGEGFPNAICEAMACGVPCIATDVGDAARIVADTGTIIPRRDETKLIAALARFVTTTADERREAGFRARQRIQAEFSLDRMIQKTTDLYVALVRDTTSCPASTAH